MFTRYTPARAIRQPCKCCSTMVDSEQSLTGDFFTIYGYARNVSRKDYSGDYSSVLVAVCMQCQDQLKLQTIPLFS